MNFRNLFPVVDLHCHLRSNIPKHTKIAKESGIDLVVYMANCQPPLDTLERIKKSLKAKRYVKALPVSAITKNLKGKKPVDIEKIKDYVIGFSDDGKCLKNLKLLTEFLSQNVLVLAHLEPEKEMLKKYLKVLAEVGGKLHFQHISKKESVRILRRAKNKGLKFTAETCPHYFIYSQDLENHKINPPLAGPKDILEIKKGLADGTIDCIASDYAPLPRKTGFAGFRNFISQSYGLVLEGVLTENQLKEKIYLNPLKIIKNSVGRKIKSKLGKL